MCESKAQQLINNFLYSAVKEQLPKGRAHLDLLHAQDFFFFKAGTNIYENYCWDKGKQQEVYVKISVRSLSADRTNKCLEHEGGLCHPELALQK